MSQLKPWLIPYQSRVLRHLWLTVEASSFLLVLISRQHPGTLQIYDSCFPTASSSLRIKSNTYCSQPSHRRPGLCVHLLSASLHSCFSLYAFPYIRQQFLHFGSLSTGCSSSDGHVSSPSSQLYLNVKTTTLLLSVLHPAPCFAFLHDIHQHQKY